MPAVILDGKVLAGDIKNEVCETVVSLRASGIVPKLAVIIAGSDPASVFYARSKVKMGQSVGVDVDVIEKKSDVPEYEILRLIEELNNNPYIHGIMVELPLPKHLSKERILGAISYLKDVDAVTPMNRGHLLAGDEKLVPATPLACIEILSRSGVSISGSRIVVVGRGETVGKPLATMLIKRDATVTVCHTKTRNLAEVTRSAEIIIAAVGKPALVTKEMVAPGTVVVDAGINETSPGKYVGDVDFAAVSEIASSITPVPGGVGSMTTVLMMRNVTIACHLQNL